MQTQTGDEQIGKRLLQKMGWTEGTGLGKNRDGPLQPLMVDIKHDRKGLLSNQELPQVQLLAGSLKAPDLGLVVPSLELAGPLPSTAVTSKHPVSVLYEFCQKNHWLPPQITESCDPDQLDGFFALVSVCGREFRGSFARTKKQARANAAVAALEGLGCVPTGLHWTA